MTSIDEAWGESFAKPKVMAPKPMPQMPVQMPPMPQMQMPPDIHPSVHHPPPQMARLARIEEPYQPPGPTRTEIYLQDSMASLHRQMEGVREELRRRDDKDEGFAKIEKLIKRVALGLLAAIIIALIITWLRAEKHVKSLTKFIGHLAASRLSVKEVIDLVST